MISSSDTSPGLTTDDEAQRLSDALKTEDELADLYIRHIALEVALEACAASAEGTRELLTSPEMTESSRSKSWFAWRPLMAAAAGIVFGMLCTSMVFAYASA
jgi:anti-sigma factor RsiW